jgi:uncharacterized protein (DUF433 family)
MGTRARDVAGALDGGGMTDTDILASLGAVTFELSVHVDTIVGFLRQSGVSFNTVAAK